MISTTVAGTEIKASQFNWQDHLPEQPRNEEEETCASGCAAPAGQ
jgi:hypothetical protein